MFHLEPGRPVPDNIRRIAAEQIAQIKTYLATPPSGDIHEGIHEARKCFKRLRGLLRMARPALGKVIYRRENIRFRDAARSLSAMRDAQALVECFDILEQVYFQRVNFTRMLPLRKKLTSRRENLNSYQAELERRVEDVVTMLEKAVSAIDEWPLADADY